MSVLADTLRSVHLTRLALTDFRSYAAVDVALEPGVTIFSGANGEGKTNLVEAVGYAATLASHRVSQDAPLIRQGAAQAIIRAGINSQRKGSHLFRRSLATRMVNEGSSLPEIAELLRHQSIETTGMACIISKVSFRFSRPSDPLLKGEDPGG